MNCYFGATIASTPVSLPPFWCTSVENNQWFAFTASSSSVCMDIEALNCASGGAIQAALLETGDCVNFTFVSDCIGNIPSGSTTTLCNNVPLVPGNVYYLMIDGSAGANCNYAINGSSAITSGPTNVCIPGGPFSYTTNSPASWSVIPGQTGANILGSNVGTQISVNFTAPGVAQVCAQNLACPNVPLYCLTVVVGEYVQATHVHYLCQGGSVTCGGQTYTSPGIYQSNVPAPSGCDSLITCDIQDIPPVSSPTQTVNLCGPADFQLCNDYYSATGYYTSMCPNWQGCDSMVSVNLTILEPTANISPFNPVLGCGANSILFLDGSGSSLAFPPATWSMLWTGPGIVGPNNQILCQVNEPGQYCLKVTHATASGFSCFDEVCITVTEMIVVPASPNVTGPATVCSNTTATYTAQLQGNVIPTSLTWITPNGEPFTPGPNNTVVVNWGTVGGQLCVTANNECGSSPPACINVTVNAGPPLPIVTGPTTACATGTLQTYTISNPTAGVTYNWTVPTGATYTGSGTSINVNFSGVAPGNVQVCATGTNNCGTSQPGCANVTITGPPATPVLTGPAQVCANGGAATFTVTNPDPNVTYTWVAPTGAVVTGSGASVTINFASSNSGQVCVTAMNGCGMPSVCQAVQVIPAPQATISGSGEFCQGITPSINLSIAVSGGTAPWTVVYTNGGNSVTDTITTSPHPISVSTAGTYTLVSVIGANGCTGTVGGSAVVTQNPTPTAVLSGGGTICAGSGDIDTLTIALTGESPWTLVWFKNGIQQPSSLSINTNPFTLPIGQNGAGTITLGTLTDNNGCVGMGSGTAVVQVFDAPTVDNIATACNALNTEYVVTFDILGGTPPFTVMPGGASLVGGAFTSNPIATGAGYNFIVFDGNGCGTITVDDAIVVCDCDTKVGVMDLTKIENCGPGTVTANYNNTVEVLDPNDDRVFVLHSGNSASIVPPIIATSTTPSVTFNPATMTYGTTYYLSAVVGNSDGMGGVDEVGDPCSQVAQGTPIVFYQLPTATIAGSTNICVGACTDLTITTTGAAPWDVTINGSVVALFSSPFTLTVCPTTTTTYILTDVTDDHCTNMVTGSETVTVNVPPTVANIVTLCDPTGTSYTVSFDIAGGDASCYTVDGVPSGASFTSPPIASGLGYNFVVSDCHGCTPVTVEDDVVDCDCLSTAGNFPSTSMNVCGTDLAAPVYDNTGEFLDADDALCFIIHAGNPQNPIATNSVAEFSFQAGMTYGQTYFICPVVGNDDGSGCVDLSDNCLSVGNCAPVVFREIPNITLGPDVSICNGDDATLTFSNATGVAPWTVTYQDAAGMVNSLTLNTSPFNFMVSPTSDETYTPIDVFDQFCPGTVSGAANVTVNNPPQIQNIVETCAPDATSYTLTFQIVGGVSPYTVNPATGTVNAGLFTSPAILNGATYNFDVDDVNGCGPVNVAGSKDCACLTDAGTMTTSLVKVCVGQMATVPVTVGDTLDPDDVLIYYLHTGSSASLGTVIATNTSPTFSFNQATMTLGTTYYISAVAGNNNGTGGVDLSDGCLDVNVGTPVVFNALPTAAISGTTSICAGQSTDITFTLTGAGPFVVSYTLNMVPATQNFPTAGTHTITVPPTVPPGVYTYTLVSVTDLNCSNVATQSATVTVNPNVDAGAPIGNFAFCQGESMTIILGDSLTSSTPGGTWTGPNGEIVPGGTFNVAGLAAGTHDYTYSVPGLPPCPSDEAIVQVVINPLPTADAGQPDELNCDISEVTLGGPGNTPGVTYQWSGNVSDPTSPNPIVTEPGDYGVTVTTPFGCTATDQATVIENVTPPTADISVSDVSCFGNDDGFITINNITNGVAPYLCSLNGSPFSSQKSFTNLSPGDHTIIIVDAVGCQTTLIFTVQEPELVTVEIQGNFEGNDPIVNLGEPVTLQIITTPPFSELDSVIWLPADIVDCDTCQSNTIYPTQQTTFQVIVDEGGCRDEDVITVFVKKVHPVYVPSGFSSNDDGLNDVLMIFSGKEVKNINSFLIFSRWGETVFGFYDFQPNDPTFGWDGKHRGEKLNPAVFVWFAEVEFIDGKVELFEGEVNLLR
ncbi:MAG: gliding motility-associated C-terminal domain-containing protein [Saprospiraceae bacterium]|nr:gliding motility-associated C-terminal domain-containing protein [Saprospiraceae bacterium]MCF8248436.1 gliding motility-associated C-terminal domain-containing protein [Saprospiraceae bacterium]MCF8281330.1 gliding motility-associated C-terminal domain-containing protein [Bacteroidales bacterium]MCF8309964.1 gliding motility-associated C-terminal domain-containing protein [Saprospiraceae bacterium]MCF8438705.1 gliding motility-associated C-terminal domain-containing protein [Saprospiraceae 